MFNAVIAWFTGKWASIVPWLIAFSGLIVSVISIRQGGINAQKQADSKQQITDLKGALNVQENVSLMPDDVVADKLRKYYRD